MNNLIQTLVNNRNLLQNGLINTHQEAEKNSNDMMSSPADDNKVDIKRSSINERVAQNTHQLKMGSGEDTSKLDLVNNKQINELISIKEKAICDQAYAQASYQIALDTSNTDSELRRILGADRQILVPMLKNSYIRTTVFEALRLVDAGDSNGANAYMTQRLSRSKSEHKKALEAIHHVIQQLIQWKANFIEWKDAIDKNVESVLGELRTNSTSSMKDQDAVYTHVPGKLKKLANELLAHLMRDIGKTARGLIGIVKLSNTSTLQLIVNLSANCSMRTKMSPDSNFQKYLAQLRGKGGSISVEPEAEVASTETSAPPEVRASVPAPTVESIIAEAIKKLNEMREGKIKEENQKVRGLMEDYLSKGTYHSTEKMRGTTRSYIGRCYRDMRESLQSAIQAEASHLIISYGGKLAELPLSADTLTDAKELLKTRMNEQAQKLKNYMLSESGRNSHELIINNRLIRVID